MTSEDIGTSEGLIILKKLFKSSAEGIILFDRDGEVVLNNPRACQMFGYEEDEMYGMKVEDFVPMNFRGEHKGYRDIYQKNPEPRRMGVGRDLSGLRKDGTTFPLELSLSYMQHEDHKLVVSFITDISIRKKNEQKLEEQRQKLKEYTNQLERKVKARTSELEHLNLGLQSQIQERKLAEEALKESLEELEKTKQEVLNSLEKEKELGLLKSRFVSMASHEFRTPLTTVLSSANLISKYTQTDQQDSRSKHVGRIKKSVQNLTNILNDFLSLEKLESGVQQVTFNAVNVMELVEEVKEEMAQYLKSKQKIIIGGESVTIKSDVHILKNVLINLISNASKYSNEGDKIEVNLRADEHCTIAIQDHGIGIPEKEQKDLFGRFFRAGNATNIQGTGLGLNIVQKYVQLLQGTISFSSKEGQGSTFTVQLPNH